MNTDTMSIINNGLQCLSQTIGVKNTEIFIATILREKFDYTKWHQNFADEIKNDEDMDILLQKTKEYRDKQKNLKFKTI